jgi:ATP-binding cassette subfamily B protein
MPGRFAHVRQLSSSDCGTAALATVAAHHRVPIDLGALWRHAGTGCDGTNLLGLARAAGELGFSTRAVRGPFEALSDLPLPAIAHVENELGLGHFVVLHQADADSVVVADPAAYVKRLSKEHFCRTWTGCLLILERDHHAREKASRSISRLVGIALRKSSLPSNSSET